MEYHIWMFIVVISTSPTYSTNNICLAITVIKPQEMLAEFISHTVETVLVCVCVCVTLQWVRGWEDVWTRSLLVCVQDEGLPTLPPNVAETLGYGSPCLP